MKVLILDDEPVIIKGLKKLIKWEEFNMDIVGEATDGNTGLDMIISLQPDVIISDICMPGKTGLDLLKYIKKNAIKSKVIFLSGYQEFSYAKDAITYGAVDYILKPIKKSNLEEALYKVIDMIDEQTKIHSVSTKSEVTNTQKLIEAIVTGKAIVGRAKELFTKADINDTPKFYCIFSIKVDNRKYKSSIAKDENELIIFSVFNLVERFIEENNRGVIIKRSKVIFSCAFFTEAENAQQDFYAIAEALTALVKNEFNLSIIIGVGEAVENFSRLTATYETSLEALEYSFFEEKNIIRYLNINNPAVSVTEDFNTEYKKLIKGILTMDSIDIISELSKSILDMIRNRYYGNKDVCINKCINIIEEIYNELQGVQLVSDELAQCKLKFINSLEYIESYNALSEAFVEHIKELLRHLYSDVKSRDTFEIMKVKQYIKNHYSENITLEGMSKIACMNQYYFSSFFKKVTGQNFKNYLIEVRMKEALRILLSSDCKTYELAEMVGYGNSRHFSDVFKEFYGKNPMDYKKQFKDY